LNGSGTTVAYNGSLMLTPLRTAAGKPQLNLGFVYRSRTAVPLSGDVRIKGTKVMTAETAVSIPPVVTGALAYWPIRDERQEWKLEYDMDFVGWDSNQSFNVRYSAAKPESYPQHWHSIYSASAGSEFKWLSPDFAPGWDIALRTGYQRSNTPVPDYTFSPVVADANWNIFAVGVGFLCREGGSLFGIVGCGHTEPGGSGPSAIGVDVAFQAAFFEPRTIAENIQQSVVGRYETTLYIGSVNFRLAF
jgi:long-chain fatty acid transport protein